MWQRVDERAVTPCITLTVKNEGGSVMVWEGYRLSQYTAITSGTQLVGQGFILVR